MKLVVQFKSFFTRFGFDNLGFYIEYWVSFRYIFLIFLDPYRVMLERLGMADEPL